MDARISAWSLLICLGLTTPLAALTADDYIIPGRVRMFDGTRCGLTQACDIFAAGLSDANCADGTGYRELVFLHALGQTTMLFGDPNDIAVTDSLFRLVQEFTVALADRTPKDLQAWPAAGPYTTVPAPKDCVLGQVDRFVAELGSITDSPTPFVVYLTPDETGLMDDLEIDYGDVLMLKGLLLAHRASLEEEPLGDAESDDAILARTRRDWADAITCYLDAIEYITSEDDPPGTDPQEDELIYIDPESRSHIDSSAAVLVTLRDALRDRGSGTQAAATRVFDIYDANSVRLGELTLTFDGASLRGEEGRLTLADGNSLEIDWFGLLDTGEIGISLFTPDLSTQGWLQGAVAGDHSTITNGVVDLWGVCSRTVAPVTAQLVGADVERARSDPNPLLGPSLPVPPLDWPLGLEELLARAGGREDWGR